ncbi:MAG: DUF359 domain-containing protein [Thermoplasmata archaeon]|nr:MAG: DUF359 domain-containing protein [Thermoplasmata archaeon]
MHSKLDKVKYKLPNYLREELRKPIGMLLDENKLILEAKERKLLVSVGDVVTYTLLSRGIKPKIAVIDYKFRRKECSEEMKKVLQGFGEKRVNVVNPPSTISQELWNALEKAYSDEKTVCIVVDGEEDMASLAAIALAPIGGTVIYGLPDKGIILVDVSPHEKDKVKKVLERCRYGDRGP